ncbi:hypothetical protein OC861_001259 [Tilletia horrida]|nr:hypothetical protein OC845_001234 [Tilletia horrida]KAK0569119.1 hypothetical protein OC861_001259 [Tilletia horrida]
MAGTVASKTGVSQKASQAVASKPANNNNKPTRISRFVAAFLRVSLLPIIAFGLPTWPILALLCAIPFVSVFVFPFFLALTLALMYAIAWFSYLILAQSDPPYRRALGGGASYLPFLPYSPMRCLKINWVAFIYATTALRVAIPAVLDWSYRRVIVLGTQAGAGIVKEGVLYGSPYPGKRLDIYLPPNFVATPASAGSSTAQASTSGVPRKPGMRARKHSYIFDEPGVVPEAGAAADRGPAPAPARTATAPVVVVLPSIIPPLTWTNKRKTYLQLALRLRRLGYCVVVPDITYFPEARIKASIVDLRLVLRWVGANISRFGGDPNKIHVMGHGFSAHLITLTLTQEAVVLSREGFLDRAYDREQRALEQQQADDARTDDRSEWDDSSSIGDEESSGKHLGDTEPSRQSGGMLAFPSSSPSQANGNDRKDGQKQTDADAWVDEPEVGGVNGSKNSSGVPPGYVMGSTQQFTQDFDAASPQLGLSEFDAMGPSSAKNKGKAAVIGDDAASASGLTFPGSASQADPAEDVDDPFMSPPRKTMTLTHRRKGSRADQGDDGTVKSSKRDSVSRPVRPRSQSRTYSSSSTNGVGSYGFHQKEPQTLSEAEEQISNGLNRVEIYEPEIELPPIAGVILLAGVSDVIKGFRNETDRGIEHLSVLRRAMGPSHTSCLLHSPAHLLFAAKNMLDTALLPPKFLLIHGGKDAVVPIEQSTLMKTLLVGVGINHVSLRAYRELGHAEALAALFLGMGKASTKYAKQIAQDIVDFVEL